MAVPIKLTNLLGSILGQNEVMYNPAIKSVQTPVSKEIFYKWEAQLAQCAYLSRLIYCPSELFLRGVQFLEYAPDVMNDIITQLEHSFYSRNDFKSLFLSQNVPETATTSYGHFYPRTGCALYTHHNPRSQINTQKTLFVVFKGSSSARDFANDLKIIKMPFNDIPELNGLPGTTHGGFYKHMREEVATILENVIQFAENVDRIVITGHSLGGAMSTLFSLMLAHAKVNRSVKLPSIHCVTFGAPNVFSDDARNAYNTFLLNHTLTLDRVTAESKGVTGSLMKAAYGPSAIDIIILLPGTFFSHPGFNILKTEMYATSKTGRAKDIDDIRAVFLGPGNVIRRSGAGPHELPADPVFWNLFTPVVSDPPLETRLANYGQMKRYKNKEFVQFVLQDIPITANDIQIDVTADEQMKVNTFEEKGMSDEFSAISASASTNVQSGGAFTFAATNSAATYKKQTQEQFPNRINYQCYKRLSGAFCHAAYMGIGFLSAIRMPILLYRDEAGKLNIKYVRKLEPTLQTIFVGESLSPGQRYYAIEKPMAGGNRRHAKTRRHAHRRKRTYRRRI
jgi:hypothetical protein